MATKKFFIIFLIILAAGILLYFVFNQGLHPIAIVEGKLINHRTFEKGYRASLYYYQNSLGANSDQFEDFEKLKGELKKSVLQNLIDNVLVDKRLTALLGNAANERVNKKIENLKLNSQEFGEATLILYGLGFQDFKDLILVPLARKEVLVEYLKTDFQDADLESLLMEARQQASVIMLDSTFSWENGAVVIN